MKKIIGLLISGSLLAAPNCFLPSLQFCYGRPEVCGKVIYWKPYGANVHYCTTLPENDDISSHQILKPDYHFGWEGQLRYLFPCECDLIEGSVLYINMVSNAEQRADRQQILDPQGNLDDFVKGTCNQRYTGADLNYLHRFFKCNCFRIDLFGGVRYAAIDERIRTFSEGEETTRIMRLTKFRGFGPRFGIATSWCPGLNFSIGGLLAVGAPTGRRRYLTETLFMGEEIDSKGKESVIVPNFDGKGFAKAAFDIDCLRFIFEVGYEIRSFSCIFYRPDLHQPVANELVGECSVSFAGPYAALAVRF